MDQQDSPHTEWWGLHEGTCGMLADTRCANDCTHTTAWLYPHRVHGSLSNLETILSTYLQLVCPCRCPIKWDWILANCAGRWSPLCVGLSNVISGFIAEIPSSNPQFLTSDHMNFAWRSLGAQRRPASLPAWSSLAGRKPYISVWVTVNDLPRPKPTWLLTIVDWCDVPKTQKYLLLWAICWFRNGGPPISRDT